MIRLKGELWQIGSFNNNNTLFKAEWQARTLRTNNLLFDIKYILIYKIYVWREILYLRFCHNNYFSFQIVFNFHHTKYRFY